MLKLLSRKKLHASSFGDTNLAQLNRCAKLERILCFVTIISILVLALFGAVAVFVNNNPKHSEVVPSNARRFARQINAENVCTTPGCAKTAESILESLDEKTDPCDNFYKFVCGGWMDKHTIRDDKSSVSVFDDVQDGLNLQLKGLLDKQLEGSESKTIKIVKDLYDSCMNVDSIEASRSEPLKNVLTSLGGWPVVVGDEWDESKFDWMETLFAHRMLGYSQDLLITMSVSLDLKNNSVHTIDLDQTTFGMPGREYLVNGLNNSDIQAYFNLMVKAAKILGANEQTAKNELSKALNFEIALANISKPDEERRDYASMYHKYTLPELKTLVPQIDWLKYFNGLLDEPITETETVVVYAKDFLKQIGDLITMTDKRIVANYMMWRIALQSLPMLSQDWKAIGQEYISEVTGQKQESPRWEQCLNALSDNLGIALSSYYIKHYFKGDSKQKAMEMLQYISREFLTILDDIDWMDEETKKEAGEKANAITPHIGYPQELLNDSIVDKYHEKLAITNENYFNNTMRINKWSTDYAFSKLRKPNIKGEWSDHAKAAVINAFYNPTENSIEFPAGILQDVFFNKDRPTYMNFGAIGYVIGHEITHGFDDMGKQFDKEGNNKNWWDQATDEKFKEKAKCIIYQYGNYTAENGMKVNGINTQGENIADNGGMKEAYRAYHSWVKDHSTEGKLPGLKYTPSQLFWISAANVWCGKYTPELLKLILVTDSHSPSEFRVNGPMSNLNEFATAFDCPSGSNMNPDKKCQVW